MLAATIFSCSTKQKHKPSPEAVAERTTTLHNIVKNLEEGNAIGDAIGITGSTQKLDLYKQLNKIATKEELISLTDHANPAVRYYSFRALANRRSDEVFKILLKHVNDTMRVVSFSGCSGMEETVVWNLVGLVTSGQIEPEGYKLNRAKSKTLDSILRKLPYPGYQSF